VKLSSGETINAAMLIGADGIWSKTRNIIMKERGLPEIRPHHCEYAYFRVVADVSGDGETNPIWHKYAF